MNYIKQVMKYTDHDNQDFWFCFQAWETTRKRTRMNKTYWAKNKRKLRTYTDTDK